MNDYQRECLEQSAWYAERATYLRLLSCDPPSADYYAEKSQLLQWSASQVLRVLRTEPKEQRS